MPDVVESHVVEVIAVLAHLPQHGIVFFGKISDDIWLSKIHIFHLLFLLYDYYVGNSDDFQDELQSFCAFYGHWTHSSTAIHPPPKRWESAGGKR